jgi:hypothetical protein
MVWLPTASLDVLKLAVVVPPVVLSVPWPILVVPSAKVTVPVGVPEPLPVTVAVNVTTWPKTDGLTEAATTVPVLPLPTPWVSVPELLRKLPSPP